MRRTNDMPTNPAQEKEITRLKRLIAVYLSAMTEEQIVSAINRLDDTPPVEILLAMSMNNQDPNALDRQLALFEPIQLHDLQSAATRLANRCEFVAPRRKAVAA